MNVDFKTKSTMKFAFIAILAISSLFSIQSFALNPADFTVTRVTAPFFPVDANQPTTFTRGYVGFEIKNVSSSSYADLKFSIESIVSSTSGFNVLFPSSKTFSIGGLAAGQSHVCYFYVSYPANSNAIASTINTKLSDNSITSKATPFAMVNRSMITSPAGGNTRQSATVASNGDIVDDITYTIAQPRAGNEADFQPSVSNLFDPSKLILVSTQIISSEVGGINVGSTDSLFFKLTNSGINNNQVIIRYRFKPGGLNTRTFVLPYCGATSGQQYKYILRDSGGVNGLALGSETLVLTKSSDKSVYNVCDTAVFTIKIQNNSPLNFSVDSINDKLPTRFGFIGFTPSSQIQNSLCSSRPMNMDTSNIRFIGGVISNGNSSFYIPAGQSLTLQYFAKVSCLPVTNVTTQASGYIGGEEFDHDTNTVTVITDPIHAPLAVNDNFTVYMGGSITKDVSFNDYSSVDGGNVWTMTSGPSHGAVTFNNGIFTYTPDANYHGMDTIRYSVCDVTPDCSSAYAAIRVQDAPLAVNDLFAPDQDTPFNGNVSGNDYQSLDGGNTWSLTTGPSHGTVTFNADGSFTYTPALGFTDIDTFYYSLCDVDNDCSTAMVKLIVQAGGTTPITLSSFNVRLANNETSVLSWNAQSEINANRYEIERSENAINFSNRGNVTAIGSPTRSQDYTYNDALNTSASKVYYRLKMVDNDGSYKYSSVVTLNLKNAGTTINTYPNPFVSNIKIDIVSQIEEVGHVKLIAIDGRVVTQFDVKLTNGNNAIQMNNLAGLPKSTYTVEVSTATNKFTKRVVKN